MGKEFRFEVKLTAKELWKFSMYHTNSGVLGIFNGLFTLVALFALVMRWSALQPSHRLLLGICAMIFTVWQPALLYFKARKQARTPVISSAMYLTFGEDGLRVEQNGQHVDFKWEQMGRMDKLPSLVILYMDRMHAYLLPMAAIGGQAEEFFEMARHHLTDKQRRRI